MSLLAIAWSSRVRPSLSLSFTLAPPPSSCSAISSRFPAHSATPSTDWPSESLSVRFGMTWRLWPLCVTWAKHKPHLHCQTQTRKNKRLSYHRGTAHQQHTTQEVLKVNQLSAVGRYKMDHFKTIAFEKYPTLIPGLERESSCGNIYSTPKEWQLKCRQIKFKGSKP